HRPSWRTHLPGPWFPAVSAGGCPIVSRTVHRARKEAAMAFELYLAEEVALDHADGLYSRREALRRLTLLGVGVPAASALMGAGGGDGAPVSPAPTGGGQAAPPPTPAVETEEITFPGPEGRTVRGAWAEADQPRGAGLVIHQTRGLNDHIRSVPGRLAASGYSALAID